MKTATAIRNSALQAWDALNGGFVRFYTGAGPTSADDAATGTLVVQCSLGNPALAIASDGQRAFFTISSGIVLATGSPGYAQFLRSDGSTPCGLMDVPGEVALSKSDWTTGEPFPAPSISISLPP